MANGDVFTDPALERQRQLALSIINRQGVQPQSLASLGANLGASFVAKRNLSRVDREQQEKTQRLFAALSGIGQQPPAQGIPVDGVDGQVNGQAVPVGLPPGTQGINPLAGALSGVEQPPAQRAGPQPISAENFQAIAAQNPQVALQLLLGQRQQQSESLRQQQQQEFQLRLAEAKQPPTIGEQLSSLGQGGIGGFEPVGVEAGPRGATLKLGRAPTSGERIARELSPAQKKIDEKFAGEFVDFQAAGGSSKIEKNLTTLQSASNRLKSGNNLTGPVLGSLPDAVRATTNPESLEVQQNVELVITESLKQLLGAQFSEKEGERLLARTYDPRLPEDINASRVDALIKQIRTSAEAKVAASDFLSENGTLKGFKGKVFSPSDITNMSLPGGKEVKKAKAQARGQPRRPTAQTDLQSKSNDDLFKILSGQ